MNLVKGVPNAIKRPSDLQTALGYTMGMDDGWANAGVPATQVIYGNAVYLYAGEIVTNILVNVTTAGAGTAPTNLKLGLWDSASTPNCLAVTADLAADARWTSQGWKESALSSTYTVPTTGVYYAAWWINGTFASTNIQLLTSTTSGPPGNKVGSNKWRRPSLKTGATTMAVNDTGTFGQVGGGFIIEVD